jgi:aryl-alcohol dehydrogenase-like predicted oxidoreductase
MDNICIGTAQFGMAYGIANKSGIPDMAEVFKTVETAAKSKIYFYDTARSYGMSEIVLGEAFERANIQDDVCVITKLRPDFFFSDYSALKDEVSQSKTRLKVKNLWALLMHRTGINGDANQFTRAIGRLKNEEGIKHFGVSVYHPDDALRLVQNPDIDVIQVPFNILDRRLLDNHFFEISEEKNKAVFIRSVFLQGLLLMEEAEVAGKQMSWALPFLGDIRRFVKQRRLDLKTFALTAVCRTIPRAKVIIGIESCTQLEENIDLIRSEEPADESLADWWKILPVYPEKLVNPSLW